MAKEDPVDSTVASLLRGGGYTNPEDKHEVEINEWLAKIKRLKAGDTSDQMDAELAEAELRTAVIRMLYGNHDPKYVAAQHIRHALENPAREISFFRSDLAKSIDGPTRAIRVFCMRCQGNNAEFIRQCPTINCVMWPFRMGHNPFYGRIADADASAEETDAQVEAMEALFLATKVEQA